MYQTLFSEIGVYKEANIDMAVNFTGLYCLVGAGRRHTSNQIVSQINANRNGALMMEGMILGGILAKIVVCGVADAGWCEWYGQMAQTF